MTRTLVEPEILLPDNKACLRLPGIDGKAKMSKSLGNCIYLSDSEEEMQKEDHVHVSPIPTTCECRIRDRWREILYLSIWMPSVRDAHFEEYLPEYKNLDELKAHYMRGGLGDVKVKKFLKQCDPG